MLHPCVNRRLLNDSITTGDTVEHVTKGVRFIVNSVAPFYVAVTNLTTGSMGVEDINDLRKVENA